MRIVTADQIESTLSYPALVDVMAEAFRTGAIAPPRHHHTMKLSGGLANATLLLMPAWTTSSPAADTAGRYLGVKIVSVFPSNGPRGMPAVQGAYLLLSAETGEPFGIRTREMTRG